MFNDRYGLTQAVIEGRKTVTRRVVDASGKYSKFRVWNPAIEMPYGLYGYNADGWVYLLNLTEGMKLWPWRSVMRIYIKS